MVSSRFSRHMTFLIPSVISSPLVFGQNEPPFSEEAFWEDVPMVMSATRISQTVVDAPLAVTVIDRRMIEASGAREIPELFRLVPGMVVGYHDGHTPSVSYHFSQDRYARQMQVLIDGRSIYATAIGGIPWASLYITLDDIERIEVVRGPNSASFGANSFLGVINIITRESILDRGTPVKTNLGSQGVREVFVRHGGGAGKFDYRVTAGFVEDDGFPQRFDYKRNQVASFRGDYALSNTDLISFEAGVGTGPRGVENRSTTSGLSPNREKTVLNHQEQIKWERSLGQGENIVVQFYHIFHRNVETFWTEPVTLASSGGIDWVVEPFYVDFSRRTQRYNLEFQHNVNLSSDVRMAWGAGLRDDQVWGAKNLMLNEEIHNHLKFGFMNLEWSVNANWLLNAGAMVEDYSTTGTDISPRAGVNYRFSPAHSLRITGSKAIRTPSMFEYASRYHYEGSTGLYSGSTLVAPGADIYEEFSVGTSQTKVEKISSYELGYHGILMDRGMEFDVKIYRDELNDLIGLSRNEPVADLSGFNHLYVNRDNYLIEGAELEAKFTINDKASLSLGYAFTEINEKVKDGGVVVEERKSFRAPENTLSMLYMKDFNGGYSASVAYYFTDRVQGWESGSEEKVREPVRRLDLKATRQFVLSGHETELALAFRNILGKYEEMEILRPRADFSELNEVDSSAYLTLKVNI